jgi:hypothetical protein
MGVDAVGVEVLAVAPVSLATPGRVYALTPLTIPIDARAPKATPAVSRFSRRVATSRARIRGSVVVSFSMVITLGSGACCSL